MALLSISELRVNYGAIKAVQDISLEIDEGKIVSLIGANGAGKSSTLNAISALVPVCGGKIIFDGHDITNEKPHQVVRLGIAQSMEGRQVFPRMSVRTNLELGGYTRNKQEVEEGIEQGFAMFPVLKERQRQMAGTLSGGEQQMLAIARALMAKPKLLMLDEPSLGLAPLVIDEVFSHIQEINRKMNTTILLVEQNARIALSISDFGFVLERGRIQHAGPAQELLHSEQVIDAYLGG